MVWSSILDSRLVLITPTARLESTGRGSRRGELFVDSRGRTALQMGEGTLRVVERGRKRVQVAGAGPVFIPGKPPIEGPIFVAQVIVPRHLPKGATPLYDASGKNIGYLTREGTFIATRITPDLAESAPESVLKKARSQIPAGAKRAFTADWKLIGYLRAATFTIVPVGGVAGLLTPTAILVALGAIGLGVGITAALGSLKRHRPR